MKMDTDAYFEGTGLADELDFEDESKHPRGDDKNRLP